MLILNVFAVASLLAAAVEWGIVLTFQGQRARREPRVNGFKKFEVGVYNKDVRELTKYGDSHPALSDDWAEIHYIEVRANTEEEARAKIAAKYPPRMGFVIVHCGLAEE